MMSYEGLFRLGLLMLLSPKYAHDISRCTGDWFDSVLCHDGRLVKVTSATYGYIYLDYCSYENIDPDRDCHQDVQNGYWSEIKLKCDNRDTCEQLRAKAHKISCWWQQRESDYVTIVYNCISPPEQTPSTIVYTTAPPQTSNPEITSHVTTEYTRSHVTTKYTRSHVTTEYTRGHVTAEYISPYPADNALTNHRQINTSLVLGCTLAAVVVVVVVVVAVVMMNKRRGESTNHANTSSQPLDASTESVPTVRYDDPSLAGAIKNPMKYSDQNTKSVPSDDSPEYNSIIDSDNPSQTHDHSGVCNPVYSNVSPSNAGLTADDCPEYDLANATDEYSVVEKPSTGAVANPVYNNVTFDPEISERTKDDIIPGGDGDMEIVDNSQYTPWDGHH